MYVTWIIVKDFLTQATNTLTYVSVYSFGYTLWTIFQYRFLFSIMLKFAYDTLNLFVRNEKEIRI